MARRGNASRRSGVFRARHSVAAAAGGAVYGAQRAPRAGRGVGVTPAGRKRPKASARSVWRRKSFDTAAAVSAAPASSARYRRSSSRNAA